MSKNSPKKRRRMERKRKQRETAKRRTRARSAAATSVAGRMRRTARWPLLECRISRSWKEDAFAQVLIARRGETGITASLFLVDLGCLGVKDCVSIVDHDEHEYRAFVDHVSEHDTLVECDPELAVKVVETGASYASELGFRPARGYSTGKVLFGDIDPGDCREAVSGGKEGRPFYVAGPSDDTARVLKVLEARLGADGFDFVVEGSAFDNAFFDGEDPEFASLAEWDDPEAPTAMRLRAAEQVLVPEIFQHALECHGEEYVQAAWNELWLRADVPMDPDDHPFGSLFAHWLAFDWVPHPADGARADPDWPDVPIARTYLNDWGDELTDFQRRFVETALSRPFSLYRVTNVVRDRFLEFEDLLTAEVHRVTEFVATAHSERGDVVFARVVPMEDEAIMVGCAPWRIPAGEPFEVGDLRASVADAGGRLGGSELRRFDRDLRRLFFAAVRAVCEGLQPTEVGAQTRVGRVRRWTRRLRRRSERKRRIRRAMGDHTPALLRPLFPD